MKRLRLHHIIAWLLLVIMGLIVFHAPLSVFVESRWPSFGEVFKSWKELMCLLALLLLAFDYTRQKKWRILVGDKIIWLITAYAVLHAISAIIFPTSVSATVAGLMIDLRYVAYFAAVYGFLKLYPGYRESFTRIALLGSLLVVGFALLQLILPADFLRHVGYSQTTIQPYLTVDTNPDYVRLQSTLRGPNPLGAYAMMVLAGVLGYLASLRDRRQMLADWRPTALGIAALIALWFSYSRSAVLGFLLVLAIVIWSQRRRISRRAQIAIAAGAVVVVSIAILLLQGTSFWHNVVVHDDPTIGAPTDSNGGHADSLRDGLARFAVQPFGAGIGSTGSASLLGNSPLVIENQYLFIAHEVGWLGLALWSAIMFLVMRALWRRRGDWRCFALFTSGLGLLLIGLMQPVWVDDTVSLVWWGLAAVFVNKGGEKRGTTTNKKAKRAA